MQRWLAYKQAGGGTLRGRMQRGGGLWTFTNHWHRCRRPSRRLKGRERERACGVVCLVKGAKTTPMGSSSPNQVNQRRARRLLNVWLFINRWSNLCAVFLRRSLISLPCHAEWGLDRLNNKHATPVGRLVVFLGYPRRTPSHRKINHSSTVSCQTGEGVINLNLAIRLQVPFRRFQKGCPVPRSKQYRFWNSRKLHIPSLSAVLLAWSIGRPTRDTLHTTESSVGTKSLFAKVAQGAVEAAVREGLSPSCL